MIKLPVSILGQITGYRIYTVSERANEITSNSISSVWYLIKMNLLQKKSGQTLLCGYTKTLNV